MSEISARDISGLQAMEKHRDIFTPEEAAAYLHLPSADSLKNLRAKQMLTGYEGATTSMMYHREDLDRCALRMCGRDPDAGKVVQQSLRMAGKR